MQAGNGDVGPSCVERLEEHLYAGIAAAAVVFHEGGRGAPVHRWGLFLMELAGHESERTEISVAQRAGSLIVVGEVRLKRARGWVSQREMLVRVLLQGKM